MDDLGAEEFDLTDPDGNGDGDAFATTGADGDAFVSAGRPVRGQPMLPALSGRLEGVQDTIVTFGLRLDGLMASFDSLRAVLSDRLTEHIDGVTRVAQSNTADIEEYRRSTERLVADLRRATSANEESLRRIGDGFEELTLTVSTVVDLMRSAANEPRDTTALVELRRATAVNEESVRRMGDGLEELGITVSTVVDLMRSAANEPRDAALVELRRTTAANEDALRRVGVRIEELVANVDTEVDLLRSATLEPRDTQALADLRKATVANEESLRQIGSGLEELVVSVATVVDLMRSSSPSEESIAERQKDAGALAELSSAFAANDVMLRGMTLQLEELVGDVATVMDRVGSATTASPRDANELAELRKAMAANDVMLRGMTAGLEELLGNADTTMDLLRSTVDGSRDAAAQPPVDRGLPEGFEKKIRDPILARLDDFEPAAEALREEMTQLRRRIGLRGKGSPSIGDDEVDRIAHAVAERIEIPRAVIDDKQLDEIVDTIVDRLQRVLEVVDDEPATSSPPRRQRGGRNT